MNYIKPYQNKVRCFFAIFFTAISFNLQAIPNEPPLKPIQGELTNGFRYAILPLSQEKNHIEVRLKVAAGSIDKSGFFRLCHYKGKKS